MLLKRLLQDYANFWSSIYVNYDLWRYLPFASQDARQKLMNWKYDRRHYEVALTK